MPIARINGRLLNFVHIPKTGGSSIKSYLMAKGPLALYTREPSEWARTTPQHIHADIYSLLIPDEFCDVRFAVVRDPLARLISEFRYRAKRCLEPSTKHCTLNDDGTVCIESHTLRKILVTFDDWVNMTFEEYRSDPYIYDNHIRPQSDFIDRDMKIFRFEYGLLHVFDWIDEFSRTRSLQLHLDRNQNFGPDFNVSHATRSQIRSFYRRDYALIEGLDRQESKMSERTGKAWADDQSAAHDVL